jgi:outer membrane cobalamin receptor
MISKRMALVCSAATFALATSVLAEDATIRSAATPAPVETGEIMVTARRVSESLTKVPASITAFSERQIERSGIQRAQDFTQLTPGVTLVSNSVEAGDTQINIRGINGARDAESSVALVVDGILKTNTSALNQSQGTLKQIEILKGPQGASSSARPSRAIVGPAPSPAAMPSTTPPISTAISAVRSRQAWGCWCPATSTIPTAFSATSISTRTWWTTSVIGTSTGV